MNVSVADHPVDRPDASADDLQQVLVALGDDLHEQVVAAGGHHHVVDLVELGDGVRRPGSRAPLDLDPDHRLPGEPELQRVGHGDDLHHAALGEPLHPLPDRGLGQADDLADGGVGASAVLLQLLDDGLGDVVEVRWPLVPLPGHGADDPSARRSPTPSLSTAGIRCGSVSHATDSLVPGRAPLQRSTAQGPSIRGLSWLSTRAGWLGSHTERLGRRGSFLRGASLSALAIGAPGLLSACGTGGAQVDAGRVREQGPELDGEDDQLLQLDRLRRPGQAQGRLDPGEVPAARPASRSTTSSDINDNETFFAKVSPQLQSCKPTGRDIFVVTDWMAARMIDLGLDPEARPRQPAQRRRQPHRLPEVARAGTPTATTASRGRAA